MSRSAFKWADIAQDGHGNEGLYRAGQLRLPAEPDRSAWARHGARRPILQIMASELSDKLLSEILELDAELTVTMHIQTVDQVKAIKTVKGKNLRHRHA